MKLTTPRALWARLTAYVTKPREIVVPASFIDRLALVTQLSILVLWATLLFGTCLNIFDIIRR